MNIILVNYLYNFKKEFVWQNVDVVKEEIKGDRLFLFFSIVSIFVSGEMLLFEETVKLQKIMLSIVCFFSLLSIVYFSNRLKRNIKLLGGV